MPKKRGPPEGDPRMWTRAEPLSQSSLPPRAAFFVTTWITR
jgi:hypothetical protein